MPFFFRRNFICRPFFACYLDGRRDFLAVRRGYRAESYGIVRKLIKSYIYPIIASAYIKASRGFLIAKSLCGIAVRISGFGKAVGPSVRHRRPSGNFKHRIDGNGCKYNIIKLFFQCYGYGLPAVCHSEGSVLRIVLRRGNGIGVCTVFKQIAAVLLRSDGFFAGFYSQRSVRRRKHEFNRVLRVRVLPSKYRVIFLFIYICFAKQRSHARCFQFVVRFGSNACRGRVISIALKAFRRLVVAVFRFYKSCCGHFALVIFPGAHSDNAANTYFGSCRVVIGNISGIITVCQGYTGCGTARGIAYYAADSLCVAVAEGGGWRIANNIACIITIRDFSITVACAARYTADRINSGDISRVEAGGNCSARTAHNAAGALYGACNIAGIAAAAYG